MKDNKKNVKPEIFRRKGPLVINAVCKRCKYGEQGEWVIRTEKPKSCPSCGSRSWNKD